MMATQPQLLDDYDEDESIVTEEEITNIMHEFGLFDGVEMGRVQRALANGCRLLDDTD